jgi:phosphoribosylamine---glycine ligase
MQRPMKVVVVGSGGREHALALRLLESESVGEVVCVPGNPGMLRLPPDLSAKHLRPVAGDPLAVIRAEGPALVVVGPEVPLCAGLADEVRALGIPCYGPSAAAAQLEGSKAFMKMFCRRHGIRTASEMIVTDLAEVERAVRSFAVPPVVKADGLCAGKGVVVAETHEEAIDAARSMLSGAAFGAAGATVVLEERLVGVEASLHAICDGRDAMLLPVAQDHKRAWDQDRGPNTGGMGTYAPSPYVTDENLVALRAEVVDKVLLGMAAEGSPFVGTLFVGLMLTASGPYVLEFNVRFGDPETQVLMMMIDGDFGLALLAAAEGRLAQTKLGVGSGYAACVVLAAEGYPEKPVSGDEITGIEAAEALPGVRVLHAGTKREGEALVTAGGRVLGVTARGATLGAAQGLAYEAVARIHFRGMHYRRDIAARAIADLDAKP